MRIVLVDVGAIAHLSGDGSISGKASINENSLITTQKGIVIDSNRIVEIRNSEELVDEYGLPEIDISNTFSLKSEKANVISLGGRSIIPGLVDSHSHLILSLIHI